MSSFYGKNGENFEHVSGETYKDVKTGKTYNAQQLVGMGARPDREEQQIASKHGFTGQNQNEIQDAQNTPEAINARDVANLPDVPSLIDPATGLMKTAYQLQNPAAMADEQNAIGKVADFANNTGTSAYAQAQMDQNKLQDLQQRGDLAGTYNTNISSGIKGLGETGGYDSGARERMIMNAGRGLATGGQKIGAATAYQDLGIRATDEQNKIGMMKELPGLYGSLGNRQTDIGKYNIDKATGSINTHYTNALEKAKLSLQNTQNIRESQAVK